MNKLYITGDFVYIHGSLRIINNCDGYYATYYDEEESLQEVNVDVIEGVPLTPEILEKNKWRKTKESFKTQSYYKKNFGVNVMTIITINGYCSVVYNITHIRYIQYVHELQHLLFGLGLNSEMEV